VDIFHGDRPPPYDVSEAVHTLAGADPKLARLIRCVGSCRLGVPGNATAFDALACIVVHQQLAGTAARAILARLVAKLGNGEESPRRLLESRDGVLRRIGLSRAKVAALRDLAAKVLEGSVPTLPVLSRLPDEEVVERVTRVRGVGRWSAEMLLLFALGRPDVLSSRDYGLRKGFAVTFGSRGKLPEPSELERRSERWRPFRSVASWYLWRAAE
jgi:DNA-3-methyladenine glycosylase II